MPPIIGSHGTVLTCLIIKLSQRNEAMGFKFSGNMKMEAMHAFFLLQRSF